MATVTTLLIIRVVLPLTVYYLSKAAALGWLQGHHSFFSRNNLGDDSDGDKKEKGAEKRT